MTIYRKEYDSLPLQNQIHVYSVDTSAFYNKNEQRIEYFLNKRRRIKNKLSKIKNKTEKQIEYIHKNNKKIAELKEKLINELKNNKDIRQLNDRYLNTKNVVSIFESILTRTLQIPANTLSTDIFIIRVYYFDVLEDLIKDGFIYNGEKYVFFSASAGQIRTKKTVFICEKALKAIEKTLMCGLTVEDINNCGGVNINKYLAYLALCNSASDQWVDFDISKSIVVDDMELNVTGLVDFIDDKTYEIIRQEMSVPVNMTDGCGMILPSKSKKSFTVRLPWIKGLLVPFPFDKFIEEVSHNGKVKDIYGKEWDIVADGIEVIFTKSQFKMWRFYRSWQEYCNNFIKYNCQAAICNEEEDVFENAKINYQMLQTLTDMTEDELTYLAGKTIRYIRKIGTDKKTMLKVFGVTKGNTNKTYLQQAIELYPALLDDVYTKEVLKDIKKKLVKEAKAGKFEINGKYTFICPDLYAFCEYLFCGNKNPSGLLKNNEVFCRLYKDIDKLDCLRAPHLMKEHAVRYNVVDEEKSKWFITNGLYTSCHDLISRILQFDVDGDKSLVVADTTFVAIAERNMKDVVPLYYQMKKAGTTLITPESMYEGMVLAYRGGNIGVYSNTITKIWNRSDINNNPEAVKVIKLLCMENNFTIDYAKTLYKPERPVEIKKLIAKYANCKVPYFFMYAKDKKRNQVAKRNDSTVNKLSKIIPNPKIRFNYYGDFDYTKLMFDAETELNQTIIDKYNELDKKHHFLISFDNEDDKYSNIAYIYWDIRLQLLSLGYSARYVTDVLIKYLYGKKHSRFKDTLWMAFGDIIVENIKSNVKEKYKYCEQCGCLFLPKNNKHKYCSICAKKVKNYQKMLWKRKYGQLPRPIEGGACD